MPEQVLMIPAYVRAGIMRTKDFPSFHFPGLLHQFLDAWFLNERIIVEAPGYPSAEDERCPKGTGD